MDYVERVKKAVEFLKERIEVSPTIGIVLGSGLGRIAEVIESPKTIRYAEIPGFPVATAPGHKGELIFGKLSGKDVVLMNGRFHYYEGHSMQDVTFPIRVMQLLGVKYLIFDQRGWRFEPIVRSWKTDDHNRSHKLHVGQPAQGKERR